MKRDVPWVNSFLWCINAKTKLNILVKANAEVKG